MIIAKVALGVTLASISLWLTLGVIIFILIATGVYDNQ